MLRLFPADYDPKTGCLADCGKLTVLSEMLSQLLSSTKEKIVLVSNYTRVQTFRCVSMATGMEYGSGIMGGTCYTLLYMAFVHVWTTYLPFGINRPVATSTQQNITSEMHLSFLMALMN